MHIAAIKAWLAVQVGHLYVALTVSYLSILFAAAASADGELPRNVYWGDTHVHTRLSVDANLTGNERLGLDDAYRFARGEAVTAHNGTQARLDRPLDFLVVADHAFNLGVLHAAKTAEPGLLDFEAGREFYERLQAIRADQRETGEQKLPPEFWLDLFRKDIAGGTEFARSNWQRVTAAADRYNDPGTFTAFIGYEWSSPGYGRSPFDGGRPGNLHRVVIFKDNAALADRILPFSMFDGATPEELWDFLDNYYYRTGGDAIAIAHNGNLSDGEMFAIMDAEGRPLGWDYAESRSRWEPLYEVTQIKGDSESHPALSPQDEFADFETWNSWNGSTMEGVDLEGWQDRKKAEYARPALKRGLTFQADLGVNPFKFGMIGSTDAHTSLATADDDNFWGKFTWSEPSADRLSGSWGKVPWTDFAASGYAAVWAEDNTREALFAAMRRKEVYATTGPRIELRFFGGWGYEADDAGRRDFVEIGYRRGVPMGGDISGAPDGEAPAFLIRAVRDPRGARLERVQLIKGWRDEHGLLHEKVYDIGRADPGGQVEFAIVWTDPDFDRDELAFYYLRVLEVPTPRWTARDVQRFGIEAPEDVRLTTRERAYSSPIWYTP